MSEGKRKKNKWYRMTEKLLYTYKSFPIRVMALMQQIDNIRELPAPGLIANYELSGGKSYSISSPVERAAVAQADAISKIERKIKNLETLREIVEISIDTMLDEEQRKLVDMIYVKKMSWQQICDKKSISKNTYYDQKDDVVKVLAWCFNYMPDEEAEELLGLFMDQALWQKSKTG